MCATRGDDNILKGKDFNTDSELFRLTSVFHSASFLNDNNVQALGDSMDDRKARAERQRKRRPPGGTQCQGVARRLQDPELVEMNQTHALTPPDVESNTAEAVQILEREVAAPTEQVPQTISSRT